MEFKAEQVADRSGCLAAASALKHWGFTGTAVQCVGGGFSAANVYRAATAEQGDYAVRSMPIVNRHTQQRHRELIRMLEFVHQAGLDSVSVPLSPVTQAPFASNGTRDLLAPPRCPSPPNPGRVDFHGIEPPTAHEAPAVALPLSSASATESRTYAIVLQNRSWYVERWREGAPIEGRHLTDDLAASAVAIVQRFHSLVRAWALQNRSSTLCVTRGPSGALQRRLAILRKLQNQLLQQLRQESDRLDVDVRGSANIALAALEHQLPALIPRVERLAAVEFNLQPVVRDLWQAHVLFSDKEVTGLIDFWSCHTDHPFVDFARLFRSWAGADIIQLSRLWQLVLVNHACTAAELELLRLLDACAVLLSPVTWLQRWLLQRVPMTQAARSRFVNLAESASLYRHSALQVS